MAFEEAFAMQQSALTVCLPLRSIEAAEPLKQRLTELSAQVIQQLKQHSPSTHFARWVIVQNPDPRYHVDPHLLFTTNYDSCTTDQRLAVQCYMQELLQAIGALTEEVWQCCQGYPVGAVHNPEVFAAFLQRHSFSPQLFYGNFAGKTVRSIRHSQAIRQQLEPLLNQSLDGQQLEQQLHQLYAVVQELEIEPDEFAYENLMGSKRLDAEEPKWLKAVEILVGVIRRVRSLGQEARLNEFRDDCERSAFHNQKRNEIHLREDKAVQNELTIFVPIKMIPGELLIFVVLELLGIASPPVLANLAEIHFARWVVLDKRKLGRISHSYLLFESNYDGSWDSYIDDFIQFLTFGMNMIWGNCVEHPIGGCQDVRYFKEYIRKYQFPAQIFYSAYPDLTVKHISANLKLSHAVLQSAANPTQLLRQAEVQPFLAGHPQKPMWPPEPGQLELEQIQGLIISGYGHLPFSRYLFLRINDVSSAKDWLKQIIPHIEMAARPLDAAGQPVKRGTAINIAFTAGGLTKLAASLDGLPREFREGMAEPNRSHQLGDVNLNDPRQWEAAWQRDGNDTIAEQRIDILLLVQSQTEAELEQVCQRQQERFGQYQIDLVQAEQGYQDLLALHKARHRVSDPQERGREHFGFRDSISQPEIEGSPKPVQDQTNLVKAGEFILGYRNEDGNFPPTLTVPASQDVPDGLPIPDKTRWSKPEKDFGRNGSYLVFRKLEQHVDLFQQYFATFEPAEREWLKAKVVGRWPSGVPLVLSPDQDLALSGEAQLDLNDFSYKDDSQGWRCPFGAHIRRMNPRNGLGSNPARSLSISKRRRIIRRGALYDNGDAGKGLLFFCINAEIRDQFEFVQQSWVNNPNFDGLAGERDPLVGYNPDNTERRLTIPQTPICRKLSLPNFVTVKGGAYFFLPSLSALHFLSY